MADAALNRRMTVRLGPDVAFAQIGVAGFDGQIELEALRLFRLPVGTREFHAERSLDLPSLGPGTTHLMDVTVAC
jgi:hypothetical protein